MWAVLRPLLVPVGRLHDEQVRVAAELTKRRIEPAVASEGERQPWRLQPHSCVGHPMRQQPGPKHKRPDTARRSWQLMIRTAMGDDDRVDALAARRAQVVQKPCQRAVTQVDHDAKPGMLDDITAAGVARLGPCATATEHNQLTRHRYRPPP
jgi:hypothetical protein